MSRPNPCDQKKLAVVYRWINLLAKSERNYGFAVCAWLCNGAVGPHPERGHLTKRGAAEIEAAIDAAKLWEPS